MTSRDDLIEEAAKAIHDVAMREYPGMPADIYGWDVQKDRDRDVYLLEARAALAVFEKAHAPTDDYPDAEGLAALRAQGEPTDAQVIHALEAYWGPQSTGFWFADQIKSMRAALRATAAVREEGWGR